jgi:hypothetical protein
MTPHNLHVEPDGSFSIVTRVGSSARRYYD